MIWDNPPHMWNRTRAARSAATQPARPTASRERIEGSRQANSIPAKRASMPIGTGQ